MTNKPTLNDVASLCDDHARLDEMDADDKANFKSDWRAYAAAVREAIAELAELRASCAELADTIKGNDAVLVRQHAEIERLTAELHSATYRAQQSAWDALSDTEKEHRIKWAMRNPV